MGKYEKFLNQILRGNSDSNISFQSLRNLLLNLGFEERIKGSHHIFRKANVEIINLQSEGKNAKSYQVKQVRKVLIDYNLIGN